MDNTQPHESSPVESKPIQNKWYTPLTRETKLSKCFSLALFIILPFVGFMVGVEYQLEHETYTSNSASNIVQRHVVNGATAPTATFSATATPHNFLVYRNDELGFEFLYPSNIPINPPSLFPDFKDYLLYLDFGNALYDANTLVIDTTAETDIRHHTSNPPIDTTGVTEEYRYIDFSGETARITTYTMSNTDGDVLIVSAWTLIEVIHKGKLFSFFMNGEKDKNNLIQSILLTFKFID